MASSPNALAAPHTWNLVSSGYAEEIVPHSTWFAEEALRWADVRSGEHVLDVATGPGTLAVAAARRGASVTAIDFAADMLAILRSRAERAGLSQAIEARIADAAALPLQDGSFDAAFSMFALNLLPDPHQALCEILRVLRPGARVVIGVSGRGMRTKGLLAAIEIIQAALPGAALPDREMPFAEPDELRAELERAGFVGVEVREPEHAIDYPSMSALWAAMSRGGAPLALVRDQMGEDRWDALSPAIIARLVERFGGGPRHLTMTANLAFGRAAP
jgi:SAM-dependent methyltransferase